MSLAKEKQCWIFLADVLMWNFFTDYDTDCMLPRGARDTTLPDAATVVFDGTEE